MLFRPLTTGIAAFQAVVPSAVPLPPALFTHVTLVTPTLSLALPETVMLASEVPIEVVEGERIVSCGDVVSALTGAVWRVTVTTR